MRSAPTGTQRTKSGSRSRPRPSKSLSSESAETFDHAVMHVQSQCYTIYVDRPYVRVCAHCVSREVVRDDVRGWLFLASPNDLIARRSLLPTIQLTVPVICLCRLPQKPNSGCTKSERRLERATSNTHKICSYLFNKRSGPCTTVVEDAS